MSNTKGKVFLVGAGPGDPGLFTLKGAAVLATADVVLHDRLVSPEILKHAPATAEILLTGKQGFAKSTAQTDIDELLVNYALQGKTVVRLKGGDVSFFSNILNELEALAANKIEFEIIPGVTSASGCAAYAGIPLTARGYSDEVHFLSLYNVDEDTTKPNRIAALQGTVVLYMSGAGLAVTTQQLKQLGMPDRKLVVVEQGTTPFQQQYFTSVHMAADDLAGKKINSPALVIIGEVVCMAEKFNWYKSSHNGHYFKELTKG